MFVFTTTEHISNHPRWDPDLQLEKVANAPIGVGTIICRRNTHSGTPVDGIMEVAEFEPEQSIGVIIHDGSTETHGRILFKAESQGRTRITNSAEFVNLDESMESTITGLVQRNVQNIKKLIESET